MSAVSYKWFSVGDLSASATIVFDNLTNMAVIAFLLTVVFGMPGEIVLKHIIPGLSIGILFCNVVFIAYAFWLSKKTGRDDITAFPAGLDAPTCIGLTLSVVGPAFLMFKQQGMSPDQAALTSWYISCACCFFIGFVKFVTSFFVHKIKDLLPSVALLGGLAGVAIGLIAFMPLINMLEFPIVSFAVLAVISMVYFAGFKLPANLPAILIAIVLGTMLYYSFHYVQTGSFDIPPMHNLHLDLPRPDFGIFGYFSTAARYFLIALPFALLVIFGTVSVTESAQVMGTNYSPNVLLMVDGISTMLIGLFGGTAQTTPYAGFPAYKKMNARSGYLFINVLLICVGAWFGLVGYFIDLIPESVLAPVLFFIGIEISMQVFLISEKKLYVAAIIGIFPSIARMVAIKLVSSPGADAITKSMLDINSDGKINNMLAIVSFGNGFIITGTLWAALFYYMIERRFLAVAITSGILSVISLFGIIHSVRLDGSMYWIGDLEANLRIVPIEYSLGYLFFGIVSVAIYLLSGKKQDELH
jgi:AGZA family xanthine/uracil permease-like MFS transporter